MARGASGETDPPNQGLLAGSPTSDGSTNVSSPSPTCRSTQTASQGQPASGPTLRKRTVSSGVKVLIAGMTLGAVVTGCAVPHVADMGSSKPGTKTSSAAKKRPAPTATPSAAAATVAATVASNVESSQLSVSVPGGDLANNSLTRSLNAGSRKLVVNYWTDQDPARWTASRSTVISLAAHIENGDNLHAVLVSGFHATLDDGTSVTTLADDKGAFTLTPPYAYSSALVVRAPNPAATSATVILEYDLLVQTAPNLMAYFRQTVIDTIHINFASNGDN